MVRSANLINQTWTAEVKRLQWTFETVATTLTLSKLRLGVVSCSPGAQRVSPDDDQAVSTACFDPVVQVEGISGQTGLSRLPGGVSKPCQSSAHQHTAALLGHKVAVTQRKTCSRPWPKLELLSFTTTALVYSDRTAADDIKSMWGGCVLQSIRRERSVEREYMFKRGVINLHLHQPL